MCVLVIVRFPSPSFSFYKFASSRSLAARQYGSSPFFPFWRRRNRFSSALVNIVTNFFGRHFDPWLGAIDHSLQWNFSGTLEIKTGRPMQGQSRPRLAKND